MPINSGTVSPTLVLFIGLFIFILVLLFATVWLWLLSKLFKFKIISFKISFYCILIATGAMIGTQIISSVLFSEQISSQLIKLMIFAWGIYFIAGSVAVKKLFKVTVV